MCFISYRRTDNQIEGRRWATWLHRSLETYEIPKELVGTRNERGEEIPKRIFPVFRDEEELATGDLTVRIYDALSHSKVLVVLCSPRTMESKHVYEEIRFFKHNVSTEAVHAAIIEGRPEGTTTEDGVCFPEPLRFYLTADGTPDSNRPRVPLAADFRLNDGMQGWTNANDYRRSLQKVKSTGLSRKQIDGLVANYRVRLEDAKMQLIAGILGVPLDNLKERDKVYQLALTRKRARTLKGWLLVVSVLAIFALLAAWIANSQYHAAIAAGLVIQHEKYASDINSAEAAHQRGNTEEVHEILNSQLPRAGRKDMREFAWHHLWNIYTGELGSRTFNSSLATVKFDRSGKSLLSIESKFQVNEPEVVVWGWKSGTKLKSLNLPDRDFSTIVSDRELNRIAATDDKGRIHIWRIGSAAEAIVLEQGAKPDVLEFAGGDQKLVSAQLDVRDSELKTLRLWDIQTGKYQILPIPKELTERGGTPSILSIAISQSQPLIAVAVDFKLTMNEVDGLTISNGNGTFMAIVSWNYMEDRTTVVFKSNSQAVPPLGHMAFSPSGDLLAAGFGTRTRGGGLLNVAMGGTPEIKLFDMKGQRTARTLSRPKGGIFYVAFPETERMLVSVGGNGTKDGEMVVWDLMTDQAKYVISQAESGYINQATIAPGGDYVAFSTNSGTQLWSLLNARRLGSFRGHSKAVRTFDVNSEGIVVSGSLDTTVKLWQSNESEKVLSPPSQENAQADITAFAFTFDPNNVLVARGKGIIRRVIATDFNKTIGEAMTHGATVQDLVVSPGGKYLTSISEEDVRVWDLDSHKLIRNIQCPKGEMRGVRVDESAGIVYLFTKAHGINTLSMIPKAFDLKSGDSIEIKLPSAEALETDPNYTPDEFGRPVFEFLGMDSQGKSMVFTTTVEHQKNYQRDQKIDEKSIQEPMYKEIVTLYERESSKTVRIMERAIEYTSDHFFRAEISPDGKYVALMERPAPFRKHFPGDAGVVVFDTESKSLVGELKGHFNSPAQMEFSKDGSHVRTTSFINSDFFLRWNERSSSNIQNILQMKHWDTRTWRQVVSMNLRPDREYQFDSSPSGNRLALTAGGDAAVYDTWSNEPLICESRSYPIALATGFDRREIPVAIVSQKTPFLPASQHTSMIGIWDFEVQRFRSKKTNFPKTRVDRIACSSKRKAIGRFKTTCHQGFAE